MKGSQVAPGRFMITFDRPKNFDLAGGTGETQIEAELRKVGAQIMPPQNGKARTSFVCEVPPGFPIGAVCRLVREGLDAERGTALVARLQDGKVFAWPIAETPEARKLPRWAAIVFDAAVPAPPPKPAAKAPAKPPAPKATPVKSAPPPAAARPAAAAAKPAPAAVKPAPAPLKPPIAVKPPATGKPAAAQAPPPKAAAKPPAKPAPKAAAKPAPKPAAKAKPPAKKPAPPPRAAAKKVSKPAVKAKKR